jgi:hypothetical protein
VRNRDARANPCRRSNRAANRYRDAGAADGNCDTGTHGDGHASSANCNADTTHEYTRADGYSAADENRNT